MVTPVPPSLELHAVAAMLCCKGYRNSCGVSMVTSWEVPHSKPKESIVVLSFQAGTSYRNGLFNDDGYMQENGVFGIKGPTQCSNMFGRPTLTLLRVALTMIWNILLSSIAYLHLEKLGLYIRMKKQYRGGQTHMSAYLFHWHCWSAWWFCRDGVLPSMIVFM